MGGLLTTIAYVPQVWCLFKLKSAREISLTFTTLFLLGIGFWLAYGIVNGLLSIILWNSVTIVLGGLMFYAKIKYGRQ